MLTISDSSRVATQLINDSSWMAQHIRESVNIIRGEWTRPSVLYPVKVYVDGSAWCCLLGENIVEGVVGFGASPNEACLEFDIAWHKKESD